jgi:hypothetical protein
LPPEDENASRIHNAGKFKYAQINLGGYSTTTETGSITYPSTM